MKKIVHDKTQKKLPQKRIKTNKQTNKNKIGTITTKQTNKTKPKRTKQAKATTTKQLKLNYHELKKKKKQVFPQKVEIEVKVFLKIMTDRMLPSPLNGVTEKKKRGGGVRGQ